MIQTAAPMSLAEVFQTLNGGATVEEIKDKIRDVVEAVRDTGNQGAITITLKFARNGGSDSRQIKVSDTVSARMPIRPRADTLFFATDEAELTRSNPDQAAFAEFGGAR